MIVVYFKSKETSARKRMAMFPSEEIFKACKGALKEQARLRGCKMKIEDDGLGGYAGDFKSW